MRAKDLQVVLGFNLLLLASLGFPQSIPSSFDQSPQPGVEGMAGSNVVDSRTRAKYVSGEDSTSPALEQTLLRSPTVDRNRDIYYKNKLEFGLDVGCLPINIPFPFDFMTGDSYTSYPLKYTLVPVTGSLRWHLDNLGGPWAFRGNWDLTFSGTVAAIARGPETRYFAYMMTMRRNFVQRNWKAAPYFDWRAGLGNIDAQGPHGVKYAQGQDFTFTLSLGSGVRYNLNPAFAVSAGVTWMHVSNANLSQGPPGNWGVRNYGINVVGPTLGLDVRLGGPKKHSEPR